jgi:hypothetical protein
MNEVTNFLKDYNTGKPLDIAVNLPRSTMIDLGITLVLSLSIIILLYFVVNAFIKR